MRVAYLLAVAPQPSSTFTNDEVSTVAPAVQLVKVGLIGASRDASWLVAPPVWSPGLWAAGIRTFIRRPGVLIDATWRLCRLSGRRPRDCVVAIRAALAACYLAERVEADIVHCQFGGPAAAGAYVWHRLTGVPYTIRAHAYEIYKPYSWAQITFQSAARVMAISEHGARTIKERWGITAPVLRVGVPLTSLPHRSRRRPGDPHRVLSVGSLEDKKGHDLVIEAIARLNRAGQRITLDVVGSGSLGQQLARQARGQAVRFLGALPSPRVRNAYRTYDLFVMGSRITAQGDRDGIPVVIMEASAAGLPVVATATGGIGELIRNGLTGRLVEPTAEAISRGIQAAFEDYEGSLEQAAAAREAVADQHDVAPCSVALLREWHRVLGPKL